MLSVSMKKAEKSKRVLVKLDATDKKILRILQGNSKITNARLSKEIGLSTAPTLERVKKLKRSGYVERYQAQLSSEKLGLSVTTFVLVRQKSQSSEQKEKFIAATQKIPEVIGCYHVAGEVDFLLKITAKNFEAYEGVLERLNEGGSVTTRSLVVLRSNINGENLPIY